MSDVMLMGVPSMAVMMSPSFRHGRRWRLLGTRLTVRALEAQRRDRHAAIGDLDRIAEALQRDEGGEVLRVGHELEVLLAVLLGRLVTEQPLLLDDLHVVFPVSNPARQRGELRLTHGDEQDLPLRGKWSTPAPISTRFWAELASPGATA
jgi:hypothetical protein